MHERNFKLAKTLGGITALFTAGICLVLLSRCGTGRAADFFFDPTFGGNGRVTSDFEGGNDDAFAVIIQSDGKVLVGGSSQGTSDDFALFRLESSGTVDTTFGTDGKVTTDIASGSKDRILALAQQSDGKILAVGYSENLNTNIRVLAAVRYIADGTLDTSFSDDGKLTLSIGVTPTEGWDIAIQADGKILIAGSSKTSTNLDFAVFRLNSNGTLDTTFDTDGRLSIGLGTGDDEARSLIIQDSGKIVVGGFASTETDNDFALIRLNVNGTLDTSFGTSGKTLTNISSIPPVDNNPFFDETGTDDRATALLQTFDKKLILAGYYEDANQKRAAMIQYTADGALDTSFNSEGLATRSIESSNLFITDAAFINTTLPIAFGYIESNAGQDILGLGFLTTGQVNQSFGDRGTITLDVNSTTDSIAAIAVSSGDNKVIAVGSTSIGTTRDFLITRIRPGG